MLLYKGKEKNQVGNFSPASAGGAIKYRQGNY